MNQSDEIKKLKKLYIKLVKEACEIKDEDPDFFDLWLQLNEIRKVHNQWMESINRGH